MKKMISVMLFVVSLKGFLIGCYHLYLPYHWGWKAGLSETPEMLEWALMSLNNLWSLLIVLLHAYLMVSFLNRFEKHRYPVAVILSAYWFLHALVITLNPMPLPDGINSMLPIAIAIPYIQSVILAFGANQTRNYLLAKETLTMRSKRLHQARS